MTLQELLARNLSAALREALNAELVAEKAVAKTFPDKVFWSIHQARELLEDAQTLLMKTTAEEAAKTRKDIKDNVKLL